jgi:hypothetical protein
MAARYARIVSTVIERVAPSAAQHFLDESLRIAVWELLFGTGSRARVEELLAQGARWQSDESLVTEDRRSAAAR